MKMKGQDLQGVPPATCGETWSGKTGISWMGEAKVEETQATVKLDTEIGAGSTSNPLIKSGFTAYQLHELQTQAIVYRHIAVGVPVPPHLAVSIWESLVATFGSEYRAMICNYYSNWFLQQRFNLKADMMDPEPRRCRRTDGKKWRCSQDAFPDQKYCERHMHRGCKRSRKLVESSKFASCSQGKAVSSLNQTSYKNSSPNLVTSSTREAPVLTLALPNRSFNTTICNDDTLPEVTVAIASNKSMSSCIVDRKNLSCKHLDESSQFLAGCYGGAKKGNAAFGGCAPPGLDFSPKSVIQELGRGRCGRTDGKKWQCKKEALPDQKYCVKHMHRGAKKKEMREGNAATLATVTIKGKEGNAALDTDHSISVSANAKSQRPEVLSTSSFNTETTISDTAIQGEAFGEISSSVDPKIVKRFL